MNRRGLLKTGAVCVALTAFRALRDFHASFAVTPFEGDPSLLPTLRDAPDQSRLALRFFLRVLALTDGNDPGVAQEN